MKAALRKLQLVETWNIERPDKVVFRVDLFRIETDALIQTERIFTEVYCRRWPVGATKMPGSPNFRQSWLFLEDFPKIESSNIQEAQQKVLEEISNFVVL